MTESIILIIFALVIVALAWKFLKGLLKTVVLVAILAAAAIYVFGVMN